MLGGILVIVQGGRSSAPLSGTTHRLLGCADYRRWNMNSTQAARTTRVLRDPALVGGGTGHERTTWQGFSPHFHDATLGDDIPGVMDAVAIEQINGPNGYKHGGDGVAGTKGDWQPYRPNPIRNYRYIDPEEDDMKDDERAALFSIKQTLEQFKDAEWGRDQAEKDRDKKRFTQVITMMGKEVDFLHKILPLVQDAATKAQVKARLDEVMTYLKNNPDVKGVDNPDDSMMPGA
jgi:hypothetical protein